MDDNDDPHSKSIELDWDTVADYAKYAESHGRLLLEAVEDRIRELAARGASIDVAEAERLGELLIEARVLLHEATLIFGPGGEDEWYYHDGREVWSGIELPLGGDQVERLAPSEDFPTGELGFFYYTWHPDPQHPRNLPHELNEQERLGHLYGHTPDGWAATVKCEHHKVIVSAPGYLDLITDGDRETPLKKS